MRFLLFFATLFLLFSPVRAGNYETFKPEVKSLFTVKIEKFHKRGKLNILNTYRDSEGDNYVLIKTQNTFPKINNIPTCRQEHSCNQGELYTMARLSPSGKLIWSINMKNAGQGFSISSFNVSPQGNVALVINFTGKIELPHSFDAFKAIQQDSLVLFYKKKSGALIKALHFTGAKNESGGKIIYGTAGEALFTLTSNSPKVAYDHGFYQFHNTNPKVVKRLLLNLKRNYFPQWMRSVEPDAYVDATFYDEGNLILGFNLFDEFFSVFNPSGLESTYIKSKKLPARGIGLVLNKEGHKVWDVTLKDTKKSNVITKTKVFPDGSAGIYAVTTGKMNIGSGKSISTREDEDSPVLLKFDTFGGYKAHAIARSNPDYMLYGKHTEHTIISASPKQKDIDSFETNSNVQGINFKKEMKCDNLLILDEDLNIKYKQDNNTCLPSSLMGAHLNISEGHLEVLHSNGKTFVELYKFKYGEEGLSDEIIPGLAYKPNFIHEKAVKGKPEYSLSYALPEKIFGAMVYFVPEGMEHKQFLLNPLIQSSLNLAYFRGYAVITAWTTDEKISPKRMEDLFANLYQKKVFQEEWQMTFQAYGKRAAQIVGLYPHATQGKLIDRILDPKFLVLWNPEGLFPSLEWGNPDEAYEKLAQRSRRAIFITNGKDLKRREMADKLNKAILDVGRVSSSIHQAPFPISKLTFSTLFLMGKEKSEVVYNDLVEKNCFSSDGRFKKSFDDQSFQGQCCKKIEIIENLPPEAQRVAIEYFGNHYHSEQFVPYFDKEIYMIIEGTSTRTSK